MRLLISICLLGTSFSLFSQHIIVRIDTILVKVSSHSEYYQITDTVWCDGDYKGDYSNLNTILEGQKYCVFYGETKNNFPWNGKSYCFDNNGLLDHIELIEKGNNKENAVLDF